VRNTSTDSTGQAWLLLGIARFEQNDPVAAREAFLNAARSSEARTSAQQWLAFIGESPAQGL